MAILFYSDLVDGGGRGATTLDEVDAALSGWVFRLLADGEVQARSSRPIEPFVFPLDGPGAEPEGVALRTIRLIAYAQEQLLSRNAYLRYLCPDCPRDGISPCPSSRRFPVRSLPTVVPSPELRFAGTGLRPSPWPRPVSKVVERLRSMAAAIQQPAVDEGSAEARDRVASQLRRFAQQWRARAVEDDAVDVDEPDPWTFFGQVMLTISRARNVEREGSDLRHSPVNFIAAVLKALAGHAASLPVPVAREAVIAALVARNAAIEGDTATVDEFTRCRLGFARPELWRDAVEAALLGDWVDALGARMSGDAEVMELLGRHARVEHLHLQPIWERKVRGRRLRLLEDPVAEGLTLRDLVPDRRLPEDGVLGRLKQDRVAAVLRCLSPAERAVAEVYAASRMTWYQAAETAGADDPAAFGERVRTKLKRLGKRRQARAAAAVRPAAVAR
ncbi:hypothetical protein [Streptomyces sp. NPDC002463]|uniref:hypothetical protein n=1 Tax=Streptomyces sp. NPDC002463 TaxID=3364645 RepID=UPI0036906185